MTPKDRFYIKDASKRAFVEIKFTHFVTIYRADYSSISHNIRNIVDDTVEARGVRADDPDTEINLFGEQFYSKPTVEASIGGVAAFGSPENLGTKLNAITTRYWKWDEKSVTARMTPAVFFAYDWFTDEITADIDRLTEAGYVYSSKEEAEAANAWDVIEFAAPKPKKTYAIKKTVETTFEVEADSQADALKAVREAGEGSLKCKRKVTERYIESSVKALKCPSRK